MTSPSAAADRIALSVTLAASREAVWSALTQGSNRWWEDLGVEPRVGEPLVERWVDADGRAQEAHGLVTSAQPGARLCFEWIVTECEAPLSLEVTLTRTPHGTQVDLIESGFDALSAGEALRQRHTLGWMEHLRRLDLAVARSA